MTVFFYDQTFEGLLSAVFEAYSSKVFPDKLLGCGTPPPLFAINCRSVVTNVQQAERVWSALRKKLPKNVCNMLTYVWLSELEGCDQLLFRYVCKTFDSRHAVAWDFGDDDVLQVSRIARKVAHESMYIKQFVRFQQAADNVYYAPVCPVYNVLPLAIDHFADRFADQQWIIYDTKRRYGYYYDLQTTSEITFLGENGLPAGKLDASLMAEDEKRFQELWKSYFKSIAIKERINPRLQRQHMPVRYWLYLTEKQ